MFSLFPINNFPNETTALIVSVIFILIFLIEIKIIKKVRRSKEDKHSLELIILGAFVPLLITILLSFIQIGKLNTNVSYIGIILILFGFALRQYSMKTLNKFFIPTVDKQVGQKIIRTGPYKYIRHPSYTGIFLELIGFSLSLSNWISTLITIILFFPAISYRIKIEENFLEENFLEKNFKDYKEYEQKTKKMIPFVY